MNEEDKNIERFLRKVFGPDDPNPVVNRNQGCDFSEKVLDYIASEWLVEPIDCDFHVQDKIMDMIDSMKGIENVPNAAGRIAIQILQL